jgi:hypothetical protein
MAKQMAYTDERGVNYAASYWKPESIHIDATSLTALIIFRGYANVTARNAQKQVIGEHTYTVYASTFVATFPSLINNPSGAFLPQCYALATSTLEGPVPLPDPNTGITPPDTRVSFFNGALDV